MKKEYHIYGLFSEGGECLYVGCTMDPKRRTWEHRTAKKIFSEMRIFKTVSKAESRAEEQAMISDYVSKGQAVLNGHPLVKDLLKVRITPQNKLLIRNYKKQHPMSPSITSIVNYAVQKFLIEESDKAKQ